MQAQQQLIHSLNRAKFPENLLDMFGTKLVTMGPTIMDTRVVMVPTNQVATDLIANDQEAAQYIRAIEDYTNMAAEATEEEFKNS